MLCIKIIVDEVLLTLHKLQMSEISETSFHNMNTAIINTLSFKKKNINLLKLKIFLFLFVVGNAVLAQSEYTVYYYENGKVSSEGMLEDGQPNGYWKTYYPNGQLKTEGNRSNFLLDSTWIFYDDEGLKTSVINYKNGKRNGEVKTFKNGVLHELSIYEDDVKTGYSKVFYPTGEVRQKTPFVDGKEEGEGYEYDLEGTIITILTYRDGNLRTVERINRRDNAGKKRGKWVEFYPDGVVAMEGQFMNDMRNGIFKFYNRKGDLINLEKYRDDELVRDSEESIILDIRSTYYPDGKVKSSGGYVDGVKQGVHRIYDESGEIMGGEIYHQGLKTAEGIIDQRGDYQGTWELFYDDGSVRARGDYENNLRAGDWVFYHRNGKVESEGKYVNGLPQGQWKWFYDNGVLRRKDYYRRGREDGESIETAPDGRVITQGEYENGLREGPWFYHVGDHIEKGNYVDGERDGKWIYEYEDGSLNYEGEYLRGMAVGKHKWYYPNGQLKMEGKYSSGLRVGKWYKYDEEGMRELEIRYRHGREFKINGKKVISTERIDESDIQ